MVNIAENPVMVDVPDLSQLNIPPVQAMPEQEEGFVPSDFGGGNFSADDTAFEGAAQDAPFPELTADFAPASGRKERPLAVDEAIKNAAETAEQIIEDAKKEAERIKAEALEEAEYEAENLFERAKDNGYEAGYKEGGHVAESMLADAKQTILKAQQEREDILKGLEPKIVHFVLDLVEKLCGSAVGANPEVLLYIIRTGLEGEAGADELEVRVSKEDYPEALKMKEEIMAMVDSDTALSIIKDTSLNPGDCIIDTPIGSIDCSFSTQWKLLKTEILLMLDSQMQ